MALEGTHMRFAFDVKNRNAVKNEAEYIQGTVYPDSRYVSKINRDLTHSNNFLKPDFVTNDFKAGWQVHLLCDKIQRRIFHENIPGFDKFTHEGYEENQWIHFTAAKIIADMKDVQSFDIQSTLKYLNSNYCPNGEDISSIQKNNQTRKIHPFAKNARLTLDTPEDLKFLHALVEQLKIADPKKQPTTDEILSCLENNQEIIKINQNVIQKTFPSKNFKIQNA